MFPCDVDEVFVNDERVPVSGDAPPFARELGHDDAVFVRLGAGVCGVRVPWARDVRGDKARIAIVRDGASGVRAFRLTVAHHDAWGLLVADAPVPGAAFWVRVADNAADPSAFTAFRAAFRASAATARADDARVEVGARGEEGPLALVANSPFFAPEKIEPQQPAAVLAVDGRDIGAEILGDVPGLAAYRAELARMKKELEENRIYVRGIRPVRWEAEKGVVTLKMRRQRVLAAGGEGCREIPPLGTRAGAYARGRFVPRLAQRWRVLAVRHARAALDAAHGLAPRPIAELDMARVPCRHDFAKGPRGTYAPHARGRRKDRQLDPDKRHDIPARRLNCRDCHGILAA